MNMDEEYTLDLLIEEEVEDQRREDHRRMRNAARKEARLKKIESRLDKIEFRLDRIKRNRR